MLGGAPKLLDKLKKEKPGWQRERMIALKWYYNIRFNDPNPLLIYRLESSIDLKGWTTIHTSTGDEIDLLNYTPDDTKRFYRIVIGEDEESTQQ